MTWQEWLEHVAILTGLCVVIVVALPKLIEWLDGMGGDGGA